MIARERRWFWWCLGARWFIEGAVKLVLNEAVYGEVIQRRVPLVEKWLWIATADIKDLHVEATKGKFVPFVGELAKLVDGGVEVR
jgi:hypothetical protein